DEGERAGERVHDGFRSRPGAASDGDGVAKTSLNVAETLDRRRSGLETRERLKSTRQKTDLITTPLTALPSLTFSLWESCQEKRGQEPIRRQDRLLTPFPCPGRPSGPVAAEVRDRSSHRSFPWICTSGY